MNAEMNARVQSRHLVRNAYLYVRQSTLHQVAEHTESARRQYGLRQRAVALGWPADQVVVIDSDQGQSGASAADRAGFQRLVSEVGLGRAGIVMGLEVSRLARNSADWHRLLEICALSDTLILDEDGIYDPAHFNDRLLLGLKGTMSEAELHIIRARLQGGLLAAARRGELRIPLPIGFVYDDEGAVRLDPDGRVQESLHMLFRLFSETGSATMTTRAFNAQGLLFPRRTQIGPREGAQHWGPLLVGKALYVLKNPRYAGAYVFGRSRHRKNVEGRYVSRRLPRNEWESLIRDAHVAYISWEQFEENLQRLAENAAARGMNRDKSPPREGPALLQGIVICGVCGKRMNVRYRIRGNERIPYYDCGGTGRSLAEPICQLIHGEALDEAIGELLVQTVNPMSIEVAASVQRQLEQRYEEADRLRYKAVESARYEADLARRRYLRIDPDNRLVATALEADWNNKLRFLEDAQQSYEDQAKAARKVMTAEQQQRIMGLATDFPRLWKDPRTSHRDRKRMVRLLIEDVTIVKTDRVNAQIRFKGGASHTLSVPLPLDGSKIGVTPKAVVEKIDRLLDEHTDNSIAAILNEQGLKTGMGLPFTGILVSLIRRVYGLKPLYDRLRDRGFLTGKELAARLAVCYGSIVHWRRAGYLVGHPFNDKNECLYEEPENGWPVPGMPHKPVVAAAKRPACANPKEEV